MTTEWFIRVLPAYSEQVINRLKTIISPQNINTINHEDYVEYIFKDHYNTAVVAILDSDIPSALEVGSFHNTAVSKLLNKEGKYIKKAYQNDYDPYQSLVNWKEQRERHALREMYRIINP